MCIMEIHPHAQTATMLQAVGHNLTTSASDLAMLLVTLQARGEDKYAEGVRLLQECTAQLAGMTVELYGIAVAEHPTVASDHHHEHVGSERTPEQIPA